MLHRSTHGLVTVTKGPQFGLSLKWHLGSPATVSCQRCGRRQIDIHGSDGAKPTKFPKMTRKISTHGVRDILS